MPDHVHVFTSTPPFDAPSKIVKLLKGTSTRHHQIFPFLREELFDGHLWSPSYYCGTADTISSYSIKHYIDSQRSKKFSSQFLSRMNSGVSMVTFYEKE